MRLHIESKGHGVYTNVHDADSGAYVPGIISMSWEMGDMLAPTRLVIERYKVRDKADVAPGESRLTYHSDGRVARERITIDAPHATLDIEGEAQVEDIPHP